MMSTFPERGGKMKELWSFEATEQFLHLVKKHEKRLHDRKTRKINIWRDITRALQKLVSYCIRYVI